MSTGPVIALRELTVGHGRQPVLERVSLDVPRGAFIGLLGANGSGKTTLLKTIAGILPPLAGRVEFSPPASIAGYVPQRDALDSAFLLSSAEIVQMGLCGRIGPAKFLGRVDREFARECLRQCGAAELAKKPFAQLSGGQKQRVLIARALAARPDVLLLDEPTAGIDPEATTAISGLLTDLNGRGKTIVMVNHDLPVVERLTDTVWWVRQGKITSGSTSEMIKDAHEQ